MAGTMQTTNVNVDVSVVVPVYRSQATLGELTQRLRNVLEGLHLSYEIIFVDDGSPDESWKVLEELQGEYPDRVVAIQLMRNFGQHNALMCGFHQARGRYILTMDDDLQHPPEEIPRLIQAIESSGADVVYGVPMDRQHRSWRNLGSVLVTAFYRIVFHTKVHPSAFRILRREALRGDSLLLFELHVYRRAAGVEHAASRQGYRRRSSAPRREGRSGYSVGRLVTLALNLFTNFSLLPLQIVSAIGLLVATAGSIMGVYYVILTLMHRIDVPGYASTIVAILVLGGCQLLALGIMGEYLGRLHLNVNRKPQYTVRTIVPANGADASSLEKHVARSRTDAAEEASSEGM